MEHSGTDSTDQNHGEDVMQIVLHQYTDDHHRKEWKYLFQELFR